MMSEAATVPIVVSEKRGAVKWIRLNRPETRNAIGTDSCEFLRREIESAADEDVRVVVLTGSGGSFCAGADLKSTSSAGLNVRDVLIQYYHPVVLAMVRSPLPVIAAVDGIAAVIGNDIALAADIRLASDRAMFSEIFVNIGLIPDGGGTFNLPRLVGTARAMEMAMTGRKVPAAEALEWGLINYVYPVDEFESKVQQFADALAEKAPLSVARSKKAIRAALDGGTLEDALMREADLQLELFETDDFREGVTAFLEKRPPKFQGK